MKLFFLKTITFLVILTFWLSYSNYNLNNALAFILRPAGGPITYVKYCTCQGSYIDHIFDYVTFADVPITFMPGASRLFALYNNFESGPQTLSNYWTIPMECLEYKGEECDSTETSWGIYNYQGTSASAS